MDKRPNAQKVGRPVRNQNSSIRKRESYKISHFGQFKGLLLIEKVRAVGPSRNQVFIRQVFELMCENFGLWYEME